MAGERPFFIVGKVVDISAGYPLVIVKVINGNLYHIHNDTPGIVFNKLKVGTLVEIEITTKLTRVLSAKIVSDADEEDGNL